MVLPSDRVCTDYHVKPAVSWSFTISFSRPGKSLIVFDLDHGTSWKVKINTCIYKNLYLSEKKTETIYNVFIRTSNFGAEVEYS